MLFAVVYQLFSKLSIRKTFSFLFKGVALLYALRCFVLEWSFRAHYVAQKIAHLYVNESLLFFLWWRHFPILLLLPRVTFLNVWICRMWCNIKEPIGQSDLSKAPIHIWASFVILAQLLCWPFFKNLVMGVYGHGLLKKPWQICFNWAYFVSLLMGNNFGHIS